MEFFENIFNRSHRKQGSVPSLVSNNSGMRYKWVPRRKRAKVPMLASVDEHIPPGFVRITGQNSCSVCASDTDLLYALQSCGHIACLFCWRSFSNSQITSFAMAHITCIACDEKLPPALVLSLLKPLPDSRLPSPTTCEAFSQFDSFQNDRAFQRYEDFLLYQCLSKDKHSRWCPRGCGYALLAYGFGSCPRIVCPRSECNGAAFCYHCREPWISNITDSPDDPAIRSTEENHTCFRNRRPSDNGRRSIISRLRDLFRFPNNTTNGGYFVAPTKSNSATRVPSAQDPDVSDSLVRRLSSVGVPTKAATVCVSDPNASTTSPAVSRTETSNDPLSNLSADNHISRLNIALPNEEMGEVKPCPCCKTYLLKLDDGSCNHMSCFICGCEFCWLCLHEVRGTHYLGPSGCTFWGRKQWPRRLRVLVMLLTAVCAPVALALLISCAVPGIIIGLPIYLVVKLRNAFNSDNVHKNRCKLILSFIVSLIFSPLVAGLAVILGVPLIMIYIYIVMPLSLFSTKDDQKSNSKEKPDPDSDLGRKVDWSKVSRDNNEE